MGDPKLRGIFTTPMAWEVEYTDEFGEWWETLTEAHVLELERRGPALPGLAARAN